MLTKSIYFAIKVYSSIVEALKLHYINKMTSNTTMRLETSGDLYLVTCFNTYVARSRAHSVYLTLIATRTCDVNRALSKLTYCHTDDTLCFFRRGQYKSSDNTLIMKTIT